MCHGHGSWKPLMIIIQSLHAEFLQFCGIYCHSIYPDLSWCVTHLIILVCIATSLGVFWNLTALDNYLELPTLYRNIAIHEFSSLKNPAHFTRYWNSPHCILKSNTFYTSYSSPYFVTIGSGGVGCCCSVDADRCAGRNRTMLKTGWIWFHVGGSCNLYAHSPTFAAMWKGPYHLSSSFFDGQPWKCVNLSDTLGLWSHTPVHPACICYSTLSCPSLPSPLQQPPPLKASSSASWKHPPLQSSPHVSALLTSEGVAYNSSRKERSQWKIGSYHCSWTVNTHIFICIFPCGASKGNTL